MKRTTASSLDQRARDNFRFVDDIIERAVAFTAVPGRGGMAMGGVALLAAPVTATMPPGAAWLSVWLAAAALAAAIGSYTIAGRLRRSGRSLMIRPAVRFAHSLLPGLVAGGLLTIALVAESMWHLLPGMWLLTYGAGVTAAGITSLRPVRNLGLCLMLTGVAALLLPAVPDLWMAIGFGGCQVFFGARITRSRHGQS